MERDWRSVDHSSTELAVQNLHPNSDQQGRLSEFTPQRCVLLYIVLQFPNNHHSAGSKAQLLIRVSMCFPESRSLHPEGAWRTSDQGLHEVFNESIALDNGTVRICQRGKKLEWASRAEFVKMRQLTAVLRLWPSPI